MKGRGSGNSGVRLTSGPVDPASKGRGWPKILNCDLSTGSAVCG